MRVRVRVCVCVLLTLQLSLLCVCVCVTDVAALAVVRSVWQDEAGDSQISVTLVQRLVEFLAAADDAVEVSGDEDGARRLPATHTHHRKHTTFHHFILLNNIIQKYIQLYLIKIIL